jgi:cytochrome P450/NADPH-cytochrome P450 reductase
VTNQKSTKKISNVVLKEIRALASDGLLSADTSDLNWKLAHKILIPTFGPQAIRGMFSEMMDIASQLILCWKRFAGEEIEVCDNLTRLTLMQWLVFSLKMANVRNDYLYKTH